MEIKRDKNLEDFGDLLKVNLINGFDTVSIDFGELV